MTRLSKEAFVESLEAEIQTYYDASPYDLGWRFLYGPVDTLFSSTVALLGLNPGGREIPAEHGEFSSEAGSAYLLESWGGLPPGEAKLQKQVLSLFDHLEVDPDSALTGNIVPFRSPSWGELRERTEALEFGKKLWSRVFQNTRPKLIICIGTQVFSEISSIFPSKPREEFPAGWGNYQIRKTEAGETSIIGLSHLSRFAIVDRQASRAGLESAFGSFWKS